MTKGKRVKPVFPIEYRLLLVQRYKERERRFVTYVGLRTVNEFSNFRYEIIVDPVVANGTVRLNVHGLRAPQLTLPSAGPALYEAELPDLRGKHEVTVAKLDGEENTFTVDISERTIVLQAEPGEKFVVVVTDPAEW